MSESNENQEVKEIIDKLSPIERKILPFLNLELKEIEKKSGLDHVSITRALTFLEAKSILKVKNKIKQVIDLGTNGIYYKKQGLPERRLLSLLESDNHLLLDEAKESSKLSDNEFKAAIGALKKKALVSLSNGKISLNAKKEEIIKKSLEEQFIDILPIEKSQLSPEMTFAFNNLNARKDIVELKEEKITTIDLTKLGKSLAGREIKSDLLEEVTPEVIVSWNKSKKFRHYDINANVPAINGGKKHFVNEAIDRGRRVWLDMGFKEMVGKKTVTSFWNFDALFTAQDHSVREMQDTFFIKDIKGKLPSNKEVINKVKEAHEKGVDGSKGWQYKWDEETAKKVLIRTHTTTLSSQTLSRLNKEDLPAKFFAIGKCFRNETVDWKHGFEFNQTEGIVIDPNANIRHLIGYLKEFAKKMGYEKVKFVPSFFPYTEPSIEGSVWNEEKKEWTEVFAAGIFRPEVTIPLLGTAIPVLAWGPGFDRLMMTAYEISDLRELYGNDLKQLRNKKRWI